MSDPSADPAVKAAFDAAPLPARATMLRLRRLVLDTAAATQGVGPLSESLKWGEPSYAPVKPRVGSPVRIAPRGADAVAVLFICHTGMVDCFRQIYPHAFGFEGNRALVVAAGLRLPEDELRHCLALALTWHRWKARI